MVTIEDSRISKAEGGFRTTCKCGAEVAFTTKYGAVKMLARGTCRNCTNKYQKGQIEPTEVYKNAEGKWSSTCSGCGREQAYTRLGHAKQSTVADWQCKLCVGKARGYAKNRTVGDKTRIYRRVIKNARNRGLEFNLTEEQMWDTYTAKCALSGVDLTTTYKGGTASLDRIDSSVGYVVGNIQWVAGKVNLAKRNLTDDEFIYICINVANTRV